MGICQRRQKSFRFHSAIHFEAIKLSTILFRKDSIFEFITRHSECSVVRACVNTAWIAIDTLALIASGGFLTNDGDLAAVLDSMAVLMTVHTNIAVGTIAGTQSAANTMVFDNNLFRPSAKNCVHWAPDQTIRVGT